jgi:predicted branched-subunit amino acid permease
MSIVTSWWARSRRFAADVALLRDVAAIAAAAGVIGVSFGAIAVASGLPGWAVVAMSVLVFAGGSQFLAVGMLAAGSPLAAVLGGLLLNARHVPFGMAVADTVGARWGARLLGSHLLIDESVAFALGQHDARRRRRAYWLTGAAMFVAWNLGTAGGVLVGASVGDPARFGLDAAFPAALLALALPTLRQQRAALRVAGVGAVVAVGTTFVVPAGLPVLLALAGLLAAGRAAEAASGGASSGTGASGVEVARG